MSTSLAQGEKTGAKMTLATTLLSLICLCISLSDGFTHLEGNGDELLQWLVSNGAKGLDNLGSSKVREPFAVSASRSSVSNSELVKIPLKLTMSQSQYTSQQVKKAVNGFSPYGGKSIHTKYSLHKQASAN